MADAHGAHPVAVTGAEGFVGRILCRHLITDGWPVRAMVRTPPEHAAPAAEVHVLGDLERADDAALQSALAGAYAVVHLAGRAHVLDERARDPQAAYHAANVEATERLARAAVRSGAQRFLFASTVKVNGEHTAAGKPFRPDDTPSPRDDYARSKLAAEHALIRACDGSRMVPLVLRLPLVYGPGVRGNFSKLLDAIAAERPLPIASIDNRRSLLYVRNLTDALATALASDRTPRGVHFLSDGASVSTPELVRAIAAALGVRARLFAVPVPLLRAAGALTRRGGEIERLVGSLEVDAQSFSAMTGWQPRYPLQQGLQETAIWWRARHSI
jgi:UDP-glucose 4-epimerase